MWNLIRLGLLVIVALLVLSFFGISIQSIIESPAGQANLSFLWGLIVIAAEWIWEIILEIIDVVIFWD